MKFLRIIILFSVSIFLYNCGSDENTGKDSPENTSNNETKSIDSDNYAMVANIKINGKKIDFKTTKGMVLGGGELTTIGGKDPDSKLQILIFLKENQEALECRLRDDNGGYWSTAGFLFIDHLSEDAVKSKSKINIIQNTDDVIEGTFNFEGRNMNRDVNDSKKIVNIEGKFKIKKKFHLTTK